MNERESQYHSERHKTIDMQSEAMKRQSTFFGLISAGIIALSIKYCTDLKTYIYFMGFAYASWLSLLISIITTYEAIAWELKIGYLTGKRLDAWVDYKMDEVNQYLSKQTQFDKIHFVFSKISQYSFYVGLFLIAIFMFENISKTQNSFNLKTNSCFQSDTCHKNYK